MSTLEEACLALGRGELVAAPTETLVGLLADATRADAVERVVRAKGRDEGKPISVILPDIEALSRVAEPLTPGAEALAQAFWPGPLTLVVRARPGLPAPLVHAGNVAVRVPGSSLALDLARRFGGPLTATSANLSSERAPQNTDVLSGAIRDACAVVLTGQAEGGIPSTLLDVTSWPPRVLRAGAVSLERLLASVAALG